MKTNFRPVQITPPRTVVFITWKELFDESPNEAEVLDVVRKLNRQNTLVFLARLMSHIFLDGALRDRSETIELQSFLIVNFFDQEVFDRAKKRLGPARLDFRIAFHPQQILTMMKWIIIYGLPAGGMESDTDESRFALGRALLKTSDLLLTAKMNAEVAQVRRRPSVKNMLRLQLSVGAGNEVANPPLVVNGLARSTVIFEELLRNTKTPIDLSKALEINSGLSLTEFVDLTLAVLTNYLGRTPKELIENPNIAILDPRTYFGPLVSSSVASKFWEMETATVEELSAAFSSSSNLIQQQDFTGFRMKPFVLLDNGNLVCVNPGFVQEKLEAGLFWTIVNSLQGDNRRNAFDSWGRLFEAYVNWNFEAAVDPAIEKYIPCPDFIGKRHRRESFDGVLVSESVCAVFECKGGFLPNSAKYADDLDLYLKGLNKKFGTEAGAGLEQLARKISQVFARTEKMRRDMAGIDLSTIEIVIPVLVVQETFASSALAVPWLVKSFRDIMRKVDLDPRIVWPSLLVLHIEDVEKLSVYVKSRAVSMIECLLFVARMGDPRPGRVFSFEQMLRAYLAGKGVQKIRYDGQTKKLDEAMSRVAMRLFNQPFEPAGTGTQKGNRNQ